MNKIAKSRSTTAATAFVHQPYAVPSNNSTLPRALVNAQFQAEKSHRAEFSTTFFNTETFHRAYLPQCGDKISAIVIDREMLIKKY